MDADVSSIDSELLYGVCLFNDTVYVADTDSIDYIDSSLMVLSLQCHHFSKR